MVVNTMSDTFAVTEDRETGRFLLHCNDEVVGFATYEDRDGVVIIPHVETVARHRGQGYGARLVDGVMDIIRADGRRVLPLCSFAAGHIRGEPRHHDLLS